MAMPGQIQHKCVRFATPLLRCFVPTCLISSEFVFECKKGEGFSKFLPSTQNSLVGDTVGCRAEISQGNARGVVRC